MSECPKCHHHHHHHHHHHRRERCECPRHECGMPMMAHPVCGAPPTMPIQGRCVMTPQGTICCVALPHHRMM